ncbi:MAG TPA: YgaP-like transmembrane domain [Bryobacteraceae bacterium]|jgi:uncharacterized membrane protein|nr:YgaP-like transmembrane domain [Bryobacteraceae bacterium]
MTTQVNNVGAAERIVSVAAGGLLIAPLLRKVSVVNATGALLGLDLVCRGVRGQSPLYSVLGFNTAAKRKPGSQIEAASPEIQRSITIGRSKEELYQFWRNETNLAHIMAHFADVTPRTNGSTHWRVRGPLKQMFEWDSQLTTDEPGSRIAWESLPGTELPNRGEVIFKDAAGGRGSEVFLRMQFEPPLGAAGASIVKALGKVPRLIAGAALRRFKSLVETGELPTLAHNPSGRGTSDRY